MYILYIYVVIYVCMCVYNYSWYGHTNMKVDTFKGIHKYLLWPLTTVVVSSSRL